MSGDNAHLDAEVARITRALIERGEDELGLMDKPVPGTTPESLVMDYRVLAEPESAKEQGEALTFLGITEAQASWVVLKRFEAEIAIRKYSRKERQRRFIEILYEQPEKFAFFEPRQSAIQNLDSLGIISAADYMP